MEDHAKKAFGLDRPLTTNRTSRMFFLVRYPIPARVESLPFLSSLFSLSAPVYHLGNWGACFYSTYMRDYCCHRSWVKAGIGSSLETWESPYYSYRDALHLDAEGKLFYVVDRWGRNGRTLKSLRTV
jgi:hypothetical protein